MSTVRAFARHVLNTEPLTEIAPSGVFPPQRRPKPYIYADGEIEALLEALRTSAPPGALRGVTYHCLFGLLSVTGLRFSEVLSLKRADVDLANGVITVRDTKFGKTRLAPIHSSTVEALEAYVDRRDVSAERRSGAYFFVGEHGRRLDRQNVHKIFVPCSKAIGLRPVVGGPRPRVHDLRHTYAVRTLLHWYRSGQDVERLLPVLTTNLGHARSEDTYWYLTACQELMRFAADRIEARWVAVS